MPRAPKTKVTTVTPVTVFECLACGMEFTRKAELTRHGKTHGSKEDKPFRCDFPGCTFAAFQLGGLITHSYKHTGEKPFKCLHCEQHFSDKGSRIRHMKRLHPDLYRPAERRKRAVPKEKQTQFRPYPSQPVAASPSTVSSTTSPSPAPASGSYYPSPLSTGSPTSVAAHASPSGGSLLSYMSNSSALQVQSPVDISAVHEQAFEGSPSTYFAGYPQHPSHNLSQYPSQALLYPTEPAYPTQPSEWVTSSSQAADEQKNEDSDFFYVDIDDLYATVFQALPANGLHGSVSSESENGQPAAAQNVRIPKAVRLAEGVSPTTVVDESNGRQYKAMMAAAEPQSETTRPEFTNPFSNNAIIAY